MKISTSMLVIIALSSAYSFILLDPFHLNEPKIDTVTVDILCDSRWLAIIDNNGVSQTITGESTMTFELHRQSLDEPWSINIDAQKQLNDQNQLTIIITNRYGSVETTTAKPFGLVALSKTYK